MFITSLQTVLFIIAAGCGAYASSVDYQDKCLKRERQAMVNFKAEITDANGQLSSWVNGTECCQGKGILCDNGTNHVVAMDRSGFQSLKGAGLGAYSSSADGTEVKCLQREKKALLQFKSNLTFYGDGLSPLSSWEHDEDCCKWDGILCDNHTNHVVALTVNGSNSMGGNLTSALLELDELTHLDLSFINFRESPIPDSIGSLGKLQYLKIEACSLGGWIPHSLGNLSQLQSLILSGDMTNSFTIPVFFHVVDGRWLSSNLEWLSNLQSLEYLNLRSINLSEANTWAEAIDNLPVVKQVHLTHCLLPSALQTSQNHLANTSNSLVVIDLSFNDINVTSVFPWLLSHASSLSYLDLSGTDTNGGVHDALKIFKNLSYLALSGNSLKGNISDAFGNLPPTVSHLDLSYNSLEGNIHDAFGNLPPAVSHLDLSKNSLQGNIQDALGNLPPAVSHLDLSYNNLKGGIPNPMPLSHPGLPINHNVLHDQHWSNLTFLDLSHNELQGDLTPFIMRLGNFTLLQHLDLSGNTFSGSWPNMSRFRNLAHLDLKDNHLYGEIEEYYLMLPNLTFLDLSGNKLNGSIPDLSACSSLRELNLNGNVFDGKLTERICSLLELEKLDLSSNRLEGLISDVHFHNLSKLQSLDLSFNSNLTVRMNPSWNPPFQLDSLGLSGCTLGPQFPEWLHNQTRLIGFLDISNATIQGTIPNWLWNNTQAYWRLNMSHNDMHGSIPDLSSTRVDYLDLRYNQFSGPLPHLPSNIGFAYLSNNNFSGTINNCSFTTTIVLDLSNNQLSGQVSSDCWSGLLSVRLLNLANNNFSGSINLPNITGYCGLISLILRKNNFTGQFPWSSMAICNQLTALDVSENMLYGDVPNWLGKSFAGLVVLCLQTNRFYGNLPSSLCQLSEIQILDVSLNNFSGTIPKCVNNFTLMSSKNEAYQSFEINGINVIDSAWIMWKGQYAEYTHTLKLLKLIDLSSNNLQGEIPLEVTSLEGLFSLNLSRNHLVGSIPPNISQLQLLNTLDLSTNNLSGSIPSTLSQLSHLGVLNLSYNNLSGKIPWDTHMKTFDGSSFIGNLELCGPPLSKPCPEDVAIETRKPKFVDTPEHEDIFKTREFCISMIFGFIVFFWAVFGSLYFNRTWNHAILKVFTAVEDWLYVTILTNKRHVGSYFQN